MPNPLIVYSQTPHRPFAPKPAWRFCNNSSCDEVISIAILVLIFIVCQRAHTFTHNDGISVLVGTSLSV